jgi:MFS family permease
MKAVKRILEITKNISAKDTKSVYYFVLALRNLAVGFMSATYTLFLLKSGLNPLQMNVVNASFMIANFIFEIPTGVYADFFGRKKSYLIHCLLLALSLFIYFLSKSLPFFILAEIVAAAAFTFASGALDAWLVDNVGEDWVTRTDYIFAQSQFFSKFTLIGGGILGGYIGSIGLAYPFLVGSIIAVLTFLAALYFMEEKLEKRREVSFAEGLKQMSFIAKDSFHYGIRNKVILWLMISTFVSFFAFQPLNMFWAPRFNQMLGDKISLMGWLWAGLSLFMMFGNALSKNLVKRKVSYWKVMIITSLFLGLPIIFSSVNTLFALAVSGFLFHEIGRGLDRPMKASYINKYIPSDKRATLISFDSMVGKAAAAMGLLFFGYFAKKTSFEASWFLAGAVLLFLIPIYLKVRQKEERQNGQICKR